MAYTAEILTSTIVVIGDFNPAIFSPDWLERNELIGEDDAAVAREEAQNKQYLISHQVSSFETDWFALQVLENQLTLTTKGVLSPAFKDLATGIFQLVPHTPIIAIGLNFIGHFKLETQEQQHKIGDTFAPKEIWDDLYPDMCAGLEQLTIRIQQGSRENYIDTKDEKRVTLQRSSKVKRGVAMSFNDHHDVTTSNDNDLMPAERVAMIIDEQWEHTWEDAIRVFDKLLSTALDKGNQSA